MFIPTEGMYRGFYDNDQGSLIFSGTAPPDLFPQERYPADRIPLDQIGTYMREFRGHTKQIKIEREAGLPHGSVGDMEQQKAASLRTTSSVFEVIGGNALLLALFKANLNTRFTGMLLADAKVGSPIIKSWFFEMCTFRGFKSVDICRKANLPFSSLRVFKQAKNSRANTLRHYVYSVFGFELEYCAIKKEGPSKIEQ